MSISAGNSSLYNTPVILFGSGLTALGTLRCLCRAGVEVYCTAKEPGPIEKSRHYRGLPVKIAENADFSEAKSALDKLAGERYVLIPCTDKWIGIVSGLGEDNPKKFLTCQPSMETIIALVDKGGLSSLLTKLEIPHPVTMEIGSEEDLAGLEITDFSGCFLKPRDSFAFFKKYRVKACRVRSREEAIDLFRKKHSEGFQMLFQEYISGGPQQHYFIDGFVDRNGKVCAIFARRRLRMYPLDFGNSTYMESISVEQVSPAVVNLKRLFKEVAFRGIFSAEFKYDARDEKFKLIEINARPWWYIEFAARCGVNVALMAYRDALNLPVAPVCEYYAGRRFVYPYYDYSAFQHLRDNGGPSVLGLMKQWIGAEFPYFSFNDPAPAVFRLSGRICQKIKKIFNSKS